MRKLILFAILFLTGTAFHSIAQDKVLPAEAKQFLVKGYEMMDYVTGDLNGDKRMDAILILKVTGEDTTFDDSAKRPLLMLIRQPNGKLKQLKRNDDLVMCRQCGGVFGDPYDNTVIENNGFTINFYGGSSWRWGYQYSFTYKPVPKTWMLTKEVQISFQSGDPETTMKEVTITADELPEQSIEKFTSGPGYDDTRWKIIATKTYFYDSPGIKNKPRKAYLLKDDVVIGIRELNNFIEVSFQNKKEQFTNGFVLKKDLTKVNK